MRRIAIAILISAFLPGIADAQTKRQKVIVVPSDARAQVKLPIPLRDPFKPNQGTTAASPAPAMADDKIMQVLAKPLQDLAAFVKNDVDAAATLSVGIPEIQDGNGLACWTAMRTAGKVFSQHPVPLTLHLASDFQNLRLIVIATRRLCDNPVCTLVFNDGVNMATAAGGGILPAPAILQQLCSRIAVIQVVPPNQTDIDALKAVQGGAAAPATPAPAQTAPSTSPNP